MKYLPLIAACSLHAAIETKIDEKNPIPVVFSRVSHNRIAVENGSIEKVVGDSSIFNVVLDKTTGQAFINVLQDIQSPTTLTVITNTGYVQDLVITAKERPSEQVILKEEEEQWEKPEIIQQSLFVEALNKIIEGKIPLGYGQRNVDATETLELPTPLKADTLKAFEGPFDTIFVYRIKNVGTQTVVLSTDALKRDIHSWVFLNNQELHQAQETICIAAQRK